MTYPIILVHGIAPFDALYSPAIRLLDKIAPLVHDYTEHWRYFRNIGSLLEHNGFEVYQANLSFAARLGETSFELADQIEEAVEKSHSKKVHIIGHSMGGLAACVAISKHGTDEFVSTLTTIGTPHHGTPVADLGMEKVGRIFKKVSPLLKIDGFIDLTTEACSEMNSCFLIDEIKNDVHYQTYSSSCPEDLIFKPLLESYRIIKKETGEDNDGLVPVNSQCWSDKIWAGSSYKNIEQKYFDFNADHINQCGWSHLKKKSDRDLQETRVKNIYMDIANWAKNIEISQV